MTTCEHDRSEKQQVLWKCGDVDASLEQPQDCCMNGLISMIYSTVHLELSKCLFLNMLANSKTVYCCNFQKDTTSGNLVVSSCITNVGNNMLVKCCLVV